MRSASARPISASTPLDDQVVVDDDVGAGQQARGAQRQQLRVAGPAPTRDRPAARQPKGNRRAFMGGSCSRGRSAAAAAAAAAQLPLGRAWLRTKMKLNSPGSARRNRARVRSSGGCCGDQHASRRRLQRRLPPSTAVALPRRCAAVASRRAATRCAALVDVASRIVAASVHARVQCSPLVRSRPARRLPCFCGPPTGNSSCR